jgi:hypothetical protein
MIDEIISIIEFIKSKIPDGSNMGWTPYNSPKELRDELDSYIVQLEANNKGCLDELYSHFLPTCTFQDISIPNGWPDEYLIIAERFDKLYYAIKKENK